MKYQPLRSAWPSARANPQAAPITKRLMEVPILIKSGASSAPARTYLTNTTLAIVVAHVSEPSAWKAAKAKVLRLRVSNRSIVLGLGVIVSSFAILIASPVQAPEVKQETSPASGARLQLTSNGLRPDRAVTRGLLTENDISLNLHETLRLDAVGAVRGRLTASALQINLLDTATKATETGTVDHLASSSGAIDISLPSISDTSVQSRSTLSVSPLDTTGTTTLNADH